jgi:hypothetical protein
MTGGSDRCTGPSSDSLRTYVFGVRRRIAGRMVMGEDEAAAGLRHGEAEEFARCACVASSVPRLIM